MFLNLRLEYAQVFHKSSLKYALKHAYLRTLKREKFHLTHAWRECVGREYQNEENFKMCTLWIDNISNLGQPLEQSINFHSLYQNEAPKYA